MKCERKIEIRAYIKAWVALHITPKEIFSESCCIHGSSAVTLRKVFLWVKKFQGGQCSLKDSNHPGSPVVAETKRTGRAKKVLYANFFNSSGPVAQIPCKEGKTI